MIRVCQRDAEANWRTPNGQSYDNLNAKINEVVPDYNPDYNINVMSPHCYKRMTE